MLDNLRDVVATLRRGLTGKGKDRALEERICRLVAEEKMKAAG
jgi:hypothetical protein